MAVIVHSTSGPFSNEAAEVRKDYYGLTGYPSTLFDGLELVIGGSNGGNDLDRFRPKFDARKVVDSPLEITLFNQHDTLSGRAEVDITVRNLSGDTVSGRLQVALCEDYVPYQWQGMDSVHLIQRTMLSDASGEKISVPPGDVVVRNRQFDIDSSWVWSNCEYVVFVQDSTSREVCQGAKQQVSAQVGVEEKAEGERMRIERRTATIVRGRLCLRGDTDAVLLDATGRPVADLKPGMNDIRDVREGVYFLRQVEPSDGTREDAEPRVPGSEGPSVRKMILQR